MSFWPSATSVSRTAHGLAYARGRIGFAAPGRPPALRLVLGHAVGFSKEAFAPTLVALGRILEQRRCDATWIALDFSGHGASREPPPEPSKWNVHHAEEIEEIIEVLGDEAVHESEVRATLPPPPPLVGFGWSMGGAVLASVEVRRRHTFKHVLMYEPPLFTRSLAALAKLLSALGLNMMANSAAKRRRVWPSLADARSHLLRRSGRSFAPAAIDAWVEGPGFRPHTGGRDSGAGAVELSCDPKYEARAYSWPSLLKGLLVLVVPQLASSAAWGAAYDAPQPVRNIALCCPSQTSRLAGRGAASTRAAIWIL